MNTKLQSKEWFLDPEDSHNILPQFDNYRRNGILCDISIQAGNSTVAAHRALLTMKIPFFHRRLVEKQENIQIAKFDTLDGKSLGPIMDLVYTGKVLLSTENVSHLLQAAGLLELTRLENACLKYITKSLAVENCFSLLCIAPALGGKKLAQSCISFIEKNFEEAVREDSQFLKVSHYQLTKLLASDKITSSEEVVLSMSIEWMRQHPGISQDMTDEIWKKIRFGLFSVKRLSALRAQGQIGQQGNASNELLALTLALHHSSFSDDDRAESILFRPRQYKEPAPSVLAIFGGAASQVIEVYDTQVTKWTDVTASTDRCMAPLPKDDPRGLCAAVANRAIYVLGGGLFSTNSVFVYDARQAKWTPTQPMKQERSHFGVAVVDGNIYAIGGLETGPFNDIFLDSAEVYNPSQKSWTMIPPMSSRRPYVAVDAINDVVYAIGGIVSSATAEAYDVTKKCWNGISKMIHSRNGASAAALNGQLFVAGGIGDIGKTAEVYDPPTNSWKAIANLTHPRKFSSMIACYNKLFIIGGMDNNSKLTMEIYDPQRERWGVAVGVCHTPHYHAGAAFLDPGPMRR